MKNFGELKNRFNEILSESIIKKDESGRKTFGKYIKMLKENEILKTQYHIFDNIENKYFEDKSDAKDYIKENISLLSKYSRRQIVDTNSKLANMISFKGGKNYEGKELHENITNLIFSDKKPNTLDSITESITLLESPAVSYNIGGSLCHGETLTFTNTSTTPVGAAGANSYEWNFGDANSSTDDSPTHQYAGPGSKTITTTARSTNGCESTITNNIVVNLKPSADFVASDVCLGSETKFTNNSSIADASTLTYDWDLNGSTSTVSNPAVTYNTAGTKTIVLVTTSSTGCTSTVTKTVEVNPLPVADIIIASQLSFDGGFSFTTNAVGTKYRWLFGDGGSDSAKSVTYKYPVDGLYTVRLVVETDKGCIGTNTDKVSVSRLGVSENSLNNNVKMYPNPGSGAFAIEFDGINTEDIKSVTVLNNLGQKVADMDLGTINNNLMNINITGQAAGIYFIQVETSNGKASFKYNLVK